MGSHWQKVNENATRIRVSNTAKDIWEDGCDYFKWCDDHPIVEKSKIKTGKNAGSEMETAFVRPYTVKGMCLHCGIDEAYIQSIRATKDKNSDYFIVISKILYIIHTQNLEGAMVGQFNPIITAKVLNLDKEEDVQHGIVIEIVGDLPRLAESENEVLEKLELENALYKK